MIDLGVNVSNRHFIDAVRRHRPEILGMSALTTATSLEMMGVMEEIKKAGLRKQVKIMVGGGAVTREYAEKIGADAFEVNTRKVIELAWHLCNK